jgi:hypothetical protein
MAGTLALNVEILGEFKKLSKATQGAEGSLKGLNQKVAGFSSGMVKALGAIGVGFSLSFIKDQLEQASKAAIEDVKSQELLAIAMKNTGKATAGTVKQAEESIKQMMLQTSVADDALRPAFQKLFIATGNVTDSNRYLQIALDTSAATGKDLDSVTQAMAKSLAGQDTALLKLIPSLRGVEDPLSELERTFKGAAEAAADTDPYTRMNIIFGEMQEEIGMALLPLLNEFSDWLTTPEGQAKLQEVVDGIVAIIEELVRTVKWIDENKDWLLPLVAGISAITAAWKIAIATVGLYKAAVALAGGTAAVSGLATAGTAIGTGAAVTGGTVAATVGTVALSAGVSGYAQSQMMLDYYDSMDILEGAHGMGNLGPARQPVASTQNVTINMNAGNITGQQIADAIRKTQRSTGTNVIRPRQ